MTAPHIPPDNHKVAVTRGRSLGGQGVGIEKFCESGRCEGQDTPPFKGGEILPLSTTTVFNQDDRQIPNNIYHLIHHTLVPHVLAFSPKTNHNAFTGVHFAPKYWCKGGSRLQAWKTFWPGPIYFKIGPDKQKRRQHLFVFDVVLCFPSLDACKCATCEVPYAAAIVFYNSYATPYTWTCAFSKTACLARGASQV